MLLRFWEWASSPFGEYCAANLASEIEYRILTSVPVYRQYHSHFYSQVASPKSLGLFCRRHSGSVSQTSGADFPFYQVCSLDPLCTLHFIRISDARVEYRDVRTLWEDFASSQLV